MRSHCGLPSRLFLFHYTFPLCHIPRTVLNNPAIHGQEDSLVDWLKKVLSQVVSPMSLSRLAVQRLHLFSYHQGEQVSVRRFILVRTSQPRLCLRKSMTDEASEGRLHRCLRRRWKQVKPLEEFVTLIKIVLCLLRYTHTNGNRAETQEAYKRHIPQEKAYSPSIKNFGIT